MCTISETLELANRYFQGDHTTIKEFEAMVAGIKEAVNSDKLHCLERTETIVKRVFRADGLHGRSFHTSYDWRSAYLDLQISVNYSKRTSVFKNQWVDLVDAKL